MKRVSKFLSFLIGLTVTVLSAFILFFLFGNLTTLPAAPVTFFSITPAVTIGSYIDETMGTDKDKGNRIKTALFKGVIIGVAVSVLNWSA